MHILAPIGFRLPFSGKTIVTNIDMTETSVTINDILLQAIVAALRGTTPFYGLNSIGDRCDWSTWCGLRICHSFPEKEGGTTG